MVSIVEYINYKSHNSSLRFQDVQTFSLFTFLLQPLLLRSLLKQIHSTLFYVSYKVSYSLRVNSTHMLTQCISVILLALSSGCFFLEGFQRNWL